MNLVVNEVAEFSPFDSGVVESVVPTSEAQREVWLADRLGPEASLAFNESVCLLLRGALDAEALRVALQALVARHESLRATFGPDGTEMLVSAATAFELPVVDLRQSNAATRAAMLRQAAERSVQTRFDLEHGPLFRGELFRLSDDEHALLMVAHHIICDGWSWGVIVEELGALYAEKIGLAPTPDEPLRYSDYVAWEGRQAAGPDADEHMSYWLGQFQGSVPVMELPCDRPRQQVRGFASRRADHVLDAELVAQVRKLGAANGASVFATLFTGFATLLARLCGQDDLVVGVPAAGQSASGMHQLVGHCVNLLPVRVGVDRRQTFGEFARQTGSRILDAFDHQTLTYGSLLQQLPVRRDPSRLPLVSVMFNVDQAVRGAGGFPGLVAELNSNPRHFENFELFVNATPHAGGLRLECQYNTQLFDAQTVARWLRLYEALLRDAVAHPDRALGALDWLVGDDRAATLALQPAPRAGDGAALMHAAFVRQAALHPQRPALSCDDVSLSYSEVESRSNRLAHALRERGVARGSRVGICLPRGLDMVVSLLAVLKTGAAYVPLDPGFPAARLGYYAEDARLALLITQSGVATAPRAWCDDAAQRVLQLDTDEAWLQMPGTPLGADAGQPQPQDAAYVIYTSGSTGKPKGVCVPHRAAANFLASMAREPGLAGDDVLAAVTTLSFDIAVLELMLPLCVGARCVIVPRDVAIDGAQLLGLLERCGASVMQATPGMWRMLIDAGWSGRSGFRALVGGESVPPDLANALLDRCAQVWNMYGPTETTVWSTCWRIDREVLARRGMSVGRPIENTTVWILDEDRQPCPIGVPGEICIGGIGVALGYLDRPELTADRFVLAATPGGDAELVYRTGDRGRWRNDGLLEHMGRFDFQVKVRGYRIELGEIEAGCNEIDTVSESVVVTYEPQPGDVRLVAYVVPVAGKSVDEVALRRHLQGKLPEYMLPQHVVSLVRMPSLPNGKIDRKALPAPDMSRAADAADRIAPRNPVEQRVVAAMEATLRLPGLGVTDDFFAMGGHSLLAAKLTAALNREFELNLPLRTVFESPTAEKLALAVQAASTGHKVVRQPIVHEPGRRSAPLTPMQERIRFVESMQPGRVVYNTPSAHRLRGAMNVDAFRRAIDEMIRRQPILRTLVSRDLVDGRAQQVVLDRLEFDLPVEDLRSLPKGEREPELMRRMQAIVDTPIDIHEAPLFRAALYRLDDEEHAFLFMPHHIVWDGWSFDVLYDELSAIYGAYAAGEPHALPPLAVTYGDYAQWFDQWLEGEEFRSQLDFWKQRFAQSPMPRPLTPEFPRKAGMSGEGSAQPVRIGHDLAERLREVGRSADVTMNMLTMAVYAALMAEIAGGDTTVIGMPVRGRPMSEVEPVMGFFNNLLPVQIATPRDVGVLDYFRSVKREMLEVMSRQDVPFERLSVEPEVASRIQKVGLYQTMFSFQDARGRVRQWGSLEHTRIGIFQKGATEDIGLWLMEVEGGLEGGIVYNTSLYSADTAMALRERYLELLRRLADDPSRTVGELLAQGDSLAARMLSRLSRPAQAPQPAADEAARATPLKSDRERAEEIAGMSDAERGIAQVWAGVLGIDAAAIGPHDSFFDLGGNSLMAMWAVQRIEKALDTSLPPSALLRAQTVRELAALLGKRGVEDGLVPIRPGGERPPMFMIHDADGETLLYRGLATLLDPGHAVWGIAPRAADGLATLDMTIEAMAAHCVERIRSVQPSGPYMVGGLCAGGVIAFEVGLRLEAMGERVAMVALIDAVDAEAERRAGFDASQRLKRFSKAFDRDDSQSLTGFVAGAVSKVVKKTTNYVTYELQARREKAETRKAVQQLRDTLAAGAVPPESARRVGVRDVYNLAMEEYVPSGILSGHAVLFRATDGAGEQADAPAAQAYDDPTLGWQRRVAKPMRCVDIPGGHSSMLQEPNVRELARQMQACIDESLGSTRAAG